MSLDLGLKGVHVLVTGASGGIGIEIIRLLKDLGAIVTAQYNSKPGDLSEIPNVLRIHADVRSEDSVTSLFREAYSHHGTHVTVLIANHGYFPPENKSVMEMDLSQWQNTLAVNLTGPFLLAKAFLRHISFAPDTGCRREANIVFVGSTSGLFGEAGHADYAASKSGLMYGLTRTLKNEIVRVAPQGRVNCVCPGWTATPKKEEVLQDQGFVQKVLATVPLQKVAQPWDIAVQVALMASSRVSGHVSGECVMVSGGMEGRLLFPPKP